MIAIYTPIFIKKYTGLPEMSTSSAQVEKKYTGLRTTFKNAQPSGNPPPHLRETYNPTQAFV